MTNRIVADASPLIILINSGLSHILPALYETILVPDGVWNEINAGKDNDLAKRSFPSLSWVSRVSISTKNELVEAYDLGIGETEVITLALSLNETSVLIDDAAARHCSTALGLPIIGTGGLLIRAAKQGLIDPFPDSLKRVRKAGLWIGPEIESLLLKKASE